MKVNGTAYRTVWMEGPVVNMIEQNLLPFDFKIHQANTCADTCRAIRNMTVRGAGAIGVTAGFAMAQGFVEARRQQFWDDAGRAKDMIEGARPTAQNLFYATNRVFNAARKAFVMEEAIALALVEAQKIADGDAEDCKRIGEYGNALIRDGFKIETHCNAGWLAFADYGSALSPIYVAHRGGKEVFVYVDETRPRSQGARLTAWELKNEEVPHVIIPDNAGAYLMAQGKIDMMIVGADRIAANGDVANKIGTLEKAIVAHAYGVPFYVAAPTSTIDKDCPTGNDIPIEERGQEEVLYQTGPDQTGRQHKILVAAPGSEAYNPAFDVTPARYVSGIITEKGIIKPNVQGIQSVLAG